MRAHGLWFDSGRACLDLMATGGAEEGLCGPGDLRCWLLGAGLVPAGTSLHTVDGDWLPPFRDLRADLADLFRAESPGAAPADAPLARVNALAAGAPPGLCAVRGADGALVRALTAGADRAALLAAVARDAVELLTDPGDRSLLRSCEGHGCTRVYLDTSRGRRRRWCSSELCGNRERVARHRRRTVAARTP
ncbi:ABATE domain-containing protein [Streptomyces bambusae]|uniref:CGNR zinc finger domain-containing protein n=1 Tax=Streptomyces bambusae TaxID=1550616 RepID=UPI001CFDBEB5|nr:ABATE domain-containing protein [Streptomyces bambusae]MCB5167294.1 ABATE domain-containing protein [Streptomyces bambusae]